MEQLVDYYPQVRCKSCNKVLASYHNTIMELLRQGYTMEQAMNSLRITRTCCRMTIMSPIHVLREPGAPKEEEMMAVLMGNMKVSASNNLPAQGTLTQIQNMKPKPAILTYPDESMLSIPPTPEVSYPPFKSNLPPYDPEEEEILQNPNVNPNPNKKVSSIFPIYHAN